MDKKESENKSVKNKNTANQSKHNAQEMALCGILIALAMILSYLESLVPIHMAVPGVKLGLANLITIIALFRLGLRDTIMISVGRIVLSSVLFGNFAVMLYSLAGACFSILTMSIMKAGKRFSVTGVSVGGAVSHNLGQILVAAIVMENARIFYYMAVLTLSGTIAGVAIGILSVYLLKNIHFKS